MIFRRDFITTTAPKEVRVSLILQKTKTRRKGAAMKVIGCDFHPSFQQIATVDTESGEYTERKLTPEEFARPMQEVSASGVKPFNRGVSSFAN